MTKRNIKFHNELKQLCAAIYPNNDIKMPNGYKLLFPKSGDNGFYAQVVQKDNDVVIVFRGTDPVDANDWRNDKQMWIKKQVPEQYEDAKNLYNDVTKFCEKNGYNLTVTGHSLGGSLAQILGAKTGVQTVTFNPYGTNNLLNENINYFQDNITNYCNSRDPITSSNARNHIGEVYELLSQAKFFDAHKLENMGDIAGALRTTGAAIQILGESIQRWEQIRNKIDRYKPTPIRMPNLYDDIPTCKGSYQVDGYTRKDGTKVEGYTRDCYIHGN